MIPLERAALGATGGAFLLLARSDRVPTLVRIGFLLAGLGLLKTAFSASPPASSGAPSLSPIGDLPRLTFEPRKARTLEERVKYIHEQALKGTESPTIYALSRSLVTDRCGDDWCIPERDHIGELTALFREVRRRVRYTSDPIVYDAFQTPEKTLALKAGDCDDEVALLAAMCLLVGYPVKTRVIHTRGEPTYNHIYLVVGLPKPMQVPPDGKTSKWMPLDPIVDKPAGWEVSAADQISPAKDFDIVPAGGG